MDLGGWLRTLGLEQDGAAFLKHAIDDQVVPYKDAALPQAKLLKKSTLKVYPGFRHGMCTTNADVINSDVLAFIRS